MRNFSGGLFTTYPPGGPLFLCAACILPRKDRTNRGSPDLSISVLYERQKALCRAFFIFGKRDRIGEMKILQITSFNVDQLVKEVVDTLRKGQIVVCPTDTVYGLLADATNKRAINRAFQIKKRKKDKPIYIFVKDMEMAKHFAEINERQEKFLQKAWPGKVTAVLQGKRLFSEGIELDGKIGLRVPDYELIHKIFGKFDKPLTGTSANISGMPSCSDSKEAIKQFQRRRYKPDLILDAGALPLSRPSTVIDITEKEHQVLRN